MFIKKIKNNSGATALEYGLIASGVALVMLGSLTLTGKSLSNTFCTITTAIGVSGSSCSGAFPKGVNMNFVPEQWGGTGTPNFSVQSISYNMRSLLGSQLQRLYNNDPITDLYGVYNRGSTIVSDGQSTTEFTPANSITSMDDVENALSNPMLYLQNGYGEGTYNTMFQMTTQSGQVYNVNAMHGDDGDSVQLQNANTGEIY